jgi:hypothetical protein
MQLYTENGTSFFANLGFAAALADTHLKPGLYDRNMRFFAFLSAVLLVFLEPLDAYVDQSKADP